MIEHLQIGNNYIEVEQVLNKCYDKSATTIDNPSWIFLLKNDMLPIYRNIKNDDIYVVTNEIYIEVKCNIKEFINSDLPLYKDCILEQGNNYCVLKCMCNAITLANKLIKFENIVLVENIFSLIHEAWCYLKN